MTPEETERMKWLCQQIQIEQDQNKFTALVEELNALVAKKGTRLKDAPKSATR